MAISYYISGRIKNKHKAWLIIGICLSVIALAFFKYVNFFIASTDGALKIFMPLGISYYSFKIVSYYVDIYRGDILQCASFVDYANYICFFPQIICGPIARAPKLLSQLQDWKCNVSVSDGLYLIICGLFKKYVIADRLSNYVSIVFDSYQTMPTLALWMGAFFYTIEIYCDFAGYSQIAIGIANLMGISTDKNFDLPYLSYSIKEFWKRWHISLSSWLKDYVYISAGGNRKGKLRTKVNLLLTFLVSGLWHGNGINFVVWGLYHGAINLIPVKESKNKVIKVLQILLTFVLVMLGWVIFRADGVITGCQYIGCMFGRINSSLLAYDNIVSSIMPFTQDYSCLSYFITVMLMILILWIGEIREFHNKKQNKVIRIMIMTVSIVLFGIVGSNSFLYANF